MSSNHEKTVDWLAPVTTPRSSATTQSLPVDRGFEYDIRLLRIRIIVMGGRVEAILSDSIKAITDGNAELARQTIASDCTVDRHKIEVDDLCCSILELRQPVASDLRFVVSALKLAIELERMANLAVNLCQSILGLGSLAPPKRDQDFAYMAAEVKSMLHEALHALVAGDASQAEMVIARDKHVDDLSALLFLRQFAHVAEDARCVTQALNLQSAVKSVERIAEHIVNLCEVVMWMVRDESVCQGVKLGGFLRVLPGCEKA
jgi:phosphate transport system protein